MNESVRGKVRVDGRMAAVECENRKGCKMDKKGYVSVRKISILVTHLHYPVLICASQTIARSPASSPSGLGLQSGSSIPRAEDSTLER